MATIKQLILDAESALVDSDSARLDAEILLALVVQKTRSWLYTWPEHIPSLPQQHLYLELVRRRQQGEPIAYLTGRKEFRDIELKINDQVLIPRPETELLVETVLKKLESLEVARVADLGTGSGAIALAMASEKPAWRVTATDQSDAAIMLASENAECLKLGNVEFLIGDWAAPLQDRTFHAILSNPPYIEESDSHLQLGDLRFEPKAALISAEQGFADLRTLIDDCADYLEPGGWLLLEHGYQQADGVRQLFSDSGYTEIETLEDLSGNDRVTMGRRKEKR